jgi:hypothetical protein
MTVFPARCCQLGNNIAELDPHDLDNLHAVCVRIEHTATGLPATRCPPWRLHSVSGVIGSDWSLAFVDFPSTAPTRYRRRDGPLARLATGPFQPGGRCSCESDPLLLVTANRCDPKRRRPHKWDFLIFGADTGSWATADRTDSTPPSRRATGRATLS